MSTNTELHGLEQAVEWAEIQLANCSWATGESNRRKVANAKARLAEYKARKNGG